MRLTARLLILLWFCLSPVAFARAQTSTPLAHKMPAVVSVFDATAVGDQIALDSGWLFQPGDNSAWSAPDLDDRSWLPVDLHKPLTAYGLRNLPFGWLRLHVHLRPDAKNLVFSTSRTLGRYQLFANGQMIGSLGDLSRHDLYDVAFPKIYPLPDIAYSKNGDLVLAMPVSLQKTSYGTGGPEAPFLTGSPFLGTERSAKDAGTARLLLGTAPLSIDAIPALITGLVALALFFSLRTRREYLYLAIYAIVNSFFSVELLLSWLHPYQWPFLVFEWLFISGTVLAFFEFVRETLGLQRTRWMMVVEFLPLATSWLTMLWSRGLVAYAVAAGVSDCGLVLAYTVLLVLLTRAALRGNVDARLLIPGTLPFIVSNLADAVFALRQATEPSLHIGSFEVRVDTIADLVLELTLLLFITTRSIRIARERNRVASEVEAAQTVQKLLLSRSEVETPAFNIQRVYRPANEVGGDFFLLQPDAEDGSVIAIVGDVSGKGLTAAMYVSMILGVLRHESGRSPGEILRNLNDALVAQAVTGFTTACCVHLQPTGAYIVANAGHISPYVAGAEVQTAPSLPLGLAANQEYIETRGELQRTQTMVLLSDGVPEARTSTGELYGFERLGKLTLQPAETIANTAQQFGQEDDITVLALSLRA